jgi:hypothetical protein
MHHEVRGFDWEDSQAETLRKANVSASWELCMNLAKLLDSNSKHACTEFTSDCLLAQESLPLQCLVAIFPGCGHAAVSPMPRHHFFYLIHMRFEKNESTKKADSLVS